LPKPPRDLGTGAGYACSADMPKFELAQFARDPQVVAGLAGANDLFGRFTRHVDLPADVAAAVTQPEGDMIVVQAGGRVDRASCTQAMLFRTAPLPVELKYTELPTVDGYRCTASVRVLIAVSPEPGELRSFRKTLLGTGDRVDVSALVQFLRWYVQHALAQFAQSRRAGDLVDMPDCGELQSLIRQKAQPACFAAGLKLIDPIEVTYQCPAYAKVRQTVEQAARKRDQLTARRHLEDAIRLAQQQHLAGLEELLAKVQTIAENSPDLSVAQLIRSFNHDQRAELYEALSKLLPPSEKTAWLLFVAGQELVWFEPPPSRTTAEPQPARRVTLDDQLGPLRSARADRDAEGRQLLLVGAQHGVHLLDQATCQAAGSFSFAPPPELSGGVNAAALLGDTLLATHSQVGLMAWDIDQPGEVRHLLTDLTAGARTVRHIQRDTQGRVWLTIDQQVLCLPADDLRDEAATTYKGCGDSITGLSVFEEEIYVATQSGGVYRWPIDRTESPETVEAPGRGALQSVQVLVLGLVARMVIPAPRAGLMVRVVGDAYSCTYSGEQIIRFAQAAPDLLVGVNDLRDRAELWHPDDPAAPLATLHVARLTGHTIQDVLLLPARRKAG